ncbi:ATP GTP hydrolase [Agrilactobacillus composti DSM 18527 = JCM 14202]|uniref:tRNA threonylcarbamoyladenosine biosynthesis protein TsaE n=1 Tax=Agrilactobacillus composti DSM 18527 = JCM 14202 TaxID=1423734 RepID=A0A0R1XYA2_9LACO|nr:tRNA (adenosine(37)-N6)-threonylcarbamoyltransferase complex ATPase subunit type 1 TsaE [Agrilactobacillus composti]KRM35168.1 ATP GTP hydrolase [Agrilactobacillus composti DSM 18527 = JCM 14202]
MQTNDAAQTITLGAKLGQLLKPGDVILLNGDLGAGKTTFTKGIAKALGIRRPVKSPTFTLIREYKEGTYPLYHMDMYRLENGGSDELGLEEYFEGQGIVIVEWSQFIQDELPLDYLVIAIHKDPDNDDIRQIEFQPKGQHYQQIVQQLEADYHDPSD